MTRGREDSNWSDEAKFCDVVSLSEVSRAGQAGASLDLMNSSKPEQREKATNWIQLSQAFAVETILQISALVVTGPAV
jgi:hypothetical protein